MIRADAVAAGVQPPREDINVQWAQLLYRLGEERRARGDIREAGAAFRLAVDLCEGLASSTDPLSLVRDARLTPMDWSA